MLPTKGYFQDIECPYFNSSCGRPYCHFRHRKKVTENVGVANEPDKGVVPTYKPTPKSELANIQNSKSHIPISYVPDLAFRHDRKLRPFPKIDRPTYKPTPLSLLSSVKQNSGIEDAKEIVEIKKTTVHAEYNPTDAAIEDISDIDFENLTTEFDLIDEIINSGDKNLKIDDATEEIQDKNDEEILMKLDEEIDKVKLQTEKLEKANLELEQTNNEYNGTKQSSDKKSRHSDSRIKSDKADCDKANEKNDSKSKSKSEKVSDKTEKREKSKSARERDKSENHKSSEKDREKRSDSKEKKDEKPHKSSSSSSSSSSSREKHRKDDKKHKSEDKKTSSHKSKHKSKEISESKGKDEDKRKNDKVDKEKIKIRSKHHDKKDKERDKKSVSSNKKPIEKKSPEAIFGNLSGSDDNGSMEDFFKNDLSLTDNDEETMLECYRIFNEYKAPEKVIETEQRIKINEDMPTDSRSNNTTCGKKRIAHANIENSSSVSHEIPNKKTKTGISPGQSLSNRYKLAKESQASREQELIINELKQAPAVKRPAPSLLEAAREHQIKRSQNQITSRAPNLIDDILQGTSRPSLSQTKISAVKKIAPAQNVGLIEKAKERISRIKQTNQSQIKTIAQTQKSGRVAHIPEVSLSDIPDVLQADKSKLPVNVRTRFLTMIADECIKLYICKNEAFNRALNEEFSCYEKCKVLTTYRNSAMLAVNRLRKEIQERVKQGLGLVATGMDSGKSESVMNGKSFYDRVHKWILTDEELDIHGYPRESEHRGKAVINKLKHSATIKCDENQKICCRCHKIYQVDDDGWPLFEEECLYHPLKKRTIKGEQTYLCCRSKDSTGCVTSDTHVSEGLESAELEGYQTTLDPEYHADPRSYAVYALDCEMCYTTKGLELTRVTIVDTECKTVYESFVKPLNPIIDYNTRFSGITKDQMDKTSTSILQIQANILHLCNSKTILVGHSLESDMKALKIVHGTIIDTSVLFPHKMGLPHKKALKALASEYLKKIIQNDVSGHDSAEDAIACMELIKWKLKEELKLRGK